MSGMLRQRSAAESPMQIGWGRLLAVLCAGTVGTWLIAATGQAGPASGGDQVIVKFTSQSEAGQALSQMNLAAIADPAEDARLIAVAQNLGERIGIPLRLESLTSGRELLLAVDYQALAAALAERLRQRDDVTGVEVADTARDGEAPRLLAEFAPESAFAEMVASGVALESLSGEGPDRLEIEVQSSDRDRAVLALDPDAITSALLARIKADPDVQYAQPNLRLRPYRAEAAEQG